MSSELWMTELHFSMWGPSLTVGLTWKHVISAAWSCIFFLHTWVSQSHFLRPPDQLSTTLSVYTSFDLLKPKGLPTFSRAVSKVISNSLESLQQYVAFKLGSWVKGKKSENMNKGRETCCQELGNSGVRNESAPICLCQHSNETVGLIDKMISLFPFKT